MRRLLSLHHDPTLNGKLVVWLAICLLVMLGLSLLTFVAVMDGKVTVSTRKGWSTMRWDTSPSLFLFAIVLQVVVMTFLLWLLHGHVARYIARTHDGRPMFRKRYPH